MAAYLNVIEVHSFDIQAAAISRFWKNHKSKIHDVIVKRSIFGNRLKEASWRIDLKAHSRHVEQINSPVVIYELELEQGIGKKVSRVYIVPFYESIYLFRFFSTKYETDRVLLSSLI